MADDLPVGGANLVHRAERARARRRLDATPPGLGPVAAAVARFTAATGAPPERTIAAFDGDGLCRQRALFPAYKGGRGERVEGLVRERGLGVVAAAGTGGEVG